MANTSSDPPFKVKALYDYASTHEDDLGFPADEVITVTAIEDDDWYYGEYKDKSSGQLKEGIFPKNFVERVVVELPPRPTRSARKKVEPQHHEVESEGEPTSPTVYREPVEERSPVAATQPAPARPMSPGDEPAPVSIPKPVEAKPAPPLVQEVPAAEEYRAPPTPASPSKASKPAPAPAAALSPTAEKKSANKPPPPEKPSSSSFKDRLALFNKGGATPIAPFNPHKPAQSFIKKPYVAPPPSKNSYVPPPAAPIQKPRRDEETAPPPRPIANEEPMRASVEKDVEEDRPKMGLKDRIALLQTQQMHPGGAPAPKPKRPPKPKREVSERSAGEDEITSPESVEHAPVRKSHDSARPLDLEEEAPPMPKRSVDIKREELGPVEYSSAGEADISSVDTPVEPRAPNPHRTAPHVHHENKSNDGDDEGANDDTPDAPDTEEGDEEGEEEEGEDVDPEVARKLALRERMAKMSGGMGMHGMFGPPMGIPMGGPPPPPKKKSTGASSSKATVEEDRPRKSYDAEEYEERSPESARPVPIPVLPFAMPRVQSPPAVEQEPESEDDELAHQNIPAGTKISEENDPEEVVDVEDMKPTHPDRPMGPRPMPGSQGSERAVPMSPPPLPQDRPAPPPPPSSERAPPPVPSAESRPPPPPPPGRDDSPTEGSESDDELSRHASKLSLSVETIGSQHRAVPPPPPPGGMMSPSSVASNSTSKRLSQSYFGQQPGSPSASPVTPTTPSTNKRASYQRGMGGVPPIPGGMSSPVANRPPPPPPPPPAGAPPPPRHSVDEPRRSMDSANAYRQSDTDDEVTEYEADYDTDMANKVAHRDALTAQHGKKHGVLDDEDSTPLPSPTVTPPHVPTRSVPPPPGPPSSAPPPPRRSVDVPRAPPPAAPPQPPQPVYESRDDDGSDDYDPYNYSVAPRHASPAPPPQQYRPPPPPMSPPQAPQSRGSGARKSMEVPRAPAGRRSMDQARSLDFIARDVDLGENTLWYTKKDTLPPVFQSRLRDIGYDIEESSPRRGGPITKDVYILFHDYSQTIITIRYDRDDPQNAEIEQRHEPPPAQPRQDQLEDFQSQFGGKIFAGAKAREGTVVGDGQPNSFVRELFTLAPGALSPVGTRSYGSLVYANLANASVQQFDEIRPGDIITFRNAKFQGHKGGLHQKYVMEAGKPDHVAVVVDWDGTKKKVRAYEQGRESKKVKIESFKVGDLRSGEVKVWRVVGKEWVGWGSQA